MRTIVILSAILFGLAACETVNSGSNPYKASNPPVAGR